MSNKTKSGSMTATLKACNTTSEKQCILDLKNVKMTLKAGSNHTPPEMVPVHSCTKMFKIKRTSKNYVVQFKVPHEYVRKDDGMVFFHGDCVLAYYDMLTDYIMRRDKEIEKITPPVDEDVPF